MLTGVVLCLVLFCLSGDEPPGSGEDLCVSCLLLSVPNLVHILLFVDVRTMGKCSRKEKDVRGSCAVFFSARL